MQGVYGGLPCETDGVASRLSALLIFIRLEYLLGLFSALVADDIFVSFSSFLLLIIVHATN